MLFNSVEFMFFFIIVTTLYFLLPHRFRWSMLLIASCIFYMAFIPVYILILFITILIDYFAGIFIEESAGKRKKLFLIASIMSTCLVLFIFKYFNFFNGTFAAIAAMLNLNYPIKAMNIILPIGLSFHTFQSLSYVIEVYRGHQKAERHFGIYALYVMFYPQLVAGPIERPQNLLYQFYEKHEFDYRRVTDGLKLMLWGMFKKVVIADRLAVAVGHVYDNATQFSGLTLIIATVFFAYQIYCDFSGYADIAIGAAQVMGFKLMDNFNRPYFSKTISEFWKRWHISLSTWFKDYLYISMGGNRVSKYRWQFNLFFTFLVSGLWHGANWTYVLWGAINGFYLVFAIWTSNIRQKIKDTIGFSKFETADKYWKILVTFSLTCFAWIFFRAKNISDAFYIATHLFVGLGKAFSLHGLRVINGEIGIGTQGFITCVLLIIFMECVHSVQRLGSIRQSFSKRPIYFRWAIYYALILSIMFLGIFGKNQFIYFQF